jgi:transcriptional regulator with PAS, ATPase and Fis domain
MQIRLLRFLQEGEIRPVGSETTRKVDVRIISATHRNLLHAIKEDAFRSDLYYRISTYPISIPPLRIRREDIPLLAAHFLSQGNRKNPGANKRLSREAINLLLLYDFPGNVRELENEIERAAAMAQNSDLILPDHLSDRIRETQYSTSEFEVPFAKKGGKLKELVEQLEQEVIEKTIIHHKGNKTKTASELGLSRLGLRKKMIRYGLEDKNYKSTTPVKNTIKIKNHTRKLQNS